MKNTPANDDLGKLKDALRAYHVALSLDIDAFLWINAELERIWKALITCADNPDYWKTQNVLAELYYVVSEAKEFATDTQNDMCQIEKEAREDEQDTINSGDG